MIIIYNAKVKSWFVILDFVFAERTNLIYKLYCDADCHGVLHAKNSF